MDMCFNYFNNCVYLWFEGYGVDRMKEELFKTIVSLFFAFVMYVGYDDIFNRIHKKLRKGLIGWKIKN